ncbi:hypothetical protein D9Q98_003571 [Chlorella vulgaris]|uniref:Uncharacterized protein n=1 Tax=Chlorella vulgaris TaxID=3077 RepID=A0A9D4TTB9_CHLVU|nr:hypothetical protein D9Q98_003571 [Chlorella vulgaris]
MGTAQVAHALVAVATVALQMTLSTVWYHVTFKRTYIRVITTRTPVFDSMGTPGRPLRSLLCTLAACLALTAVINWLLLRFQLHNWQEGARLGAALLLIDVCLNARHHFLEGRSTMLFLLHFGFHALMLGGTCCLLAEFG